MAKSEELTNGDTTINGFDHSSPSPEEFTYSPNSKRKRLQKPKAVEECTNAHILVENLLKAEPLTNGHEKTSKPCRRSERKIIPNSLWDNAVINPFYERKRRKVAPKFKEAFKEVCNGDSPKENEVQPDPDSNGVSHVRLRRSSRKLSSSVTSISDSKYTLKGAEASEDGGETPSSPQPEAKDGEDVKVEEELESPIAVVISDSENEVSFTEETVEEEEPGGGKDELEVGKKEEKIEEEEKKTGKNEGMIGKEDEKTGKEEEQTGKEEGQTGEEETPKEEEVIEEPVTEGRRGKKRGRKPKSPRDGEEIVVSKDGLRSKEAIQLIDGSSFQRFYRMRTRRQNSSTGVPETPADATTPTSTPTSTGVKRRAVTRNNSGASESEVKKRTKTVKPDILCSFCLQTNEERSEEMISCCLCGASGHPSCLQFNSALTERVKLYDWECIECKKCEICRNPGDDATLLFCDDCDKGFHMSCLDPPLEGEPDGHWSCLHCVEGSTYWETIVKTQQPPSDKSRRRKVSDKAAKRKQLLDDLAMFHEAQSRAQAAMVEEAKATPKLKAVKKKGVPAVPLTIKSIELGCYEINTWYSSPYPAEYAQQSKLFICEFCLKYMKSSTIAFRHTAKCPARCPPGDEIYRKDSVSVFEVDGRKNKTYCQNLCLLAKLFLDHKTLYYDVEPFLFYILTEYDRKGCHIVGYFSKEKNSFLCYNVSCILVLPPYMKRGYGKMLIDFSYALSRREGKLGSPEKPLSDLGLVSYRSYWKDKLLEYFTTYNESEITIKHISQTLGFNPYDIVSTLQAYGMIKYHKSTHFILKRPEMLSAWKRKQAASSSLPCRSIDMSRLKWTPPHQRK